MEDDMREAPSHDIGTRRGEDIGEGDEPGREEEGTRGAGRPAGTSTARDSTGINPDFEEPIDPEMPNLRTP